MRSLWRITGALCVFAGVMLWRDIHPATGPLDAYAALKIIVAWVILWSGIGMRDICEQLRENEPCRKP
jgi:hypothetical protein